MNISLNASSVHANEALARWQEQVAKEKDQTLATWMKAYASSDDGKALLSTILIHSPHLSHFLLLYPGLLQTAQHKTSSVLFDTLINEMRDSAANATDMNALMRVLRITKGKIALVTACADIMQEWRLSEVTGHLTHFAETALTLTFNFLLHTAHQRGEIVLSNPANPSQASGLIVLGMGKLGAYELNYSSDIDLILFYEKGALQYKGRHTEQKFFNKIAHDAVQIMQERTADGYVFRTDLRLRPDPASTPPVINIEAASNYYESVGQNWERAAMIKARPVAGDIAAGKAFMQRLTPFMWRRSLDFAAINDIHSIKRQMDHRTGSTITVPGHNIKLGLGGIREIEFYVQVNQLIWGGREPLLRLQGTCESLVVLEKLQLITSEQHHVLNHAYDFLRTLEHRLQMVDDQQTHSLPETEEGVAHIATFMGYEVEAFSNVLLANLHAVHDIFVSSFKSAENLGDEGNLVFTGVTHDPDTLLTLKRMGYKYPEVVSELVMGWHHGSRRCTRTKRARELLTELMPLLLKRLSETADPDVAFLKFDAFLFDLPAGVQLFSLFTAYPTLLNLIADIMGSAPVLAETLSKHPDLLDGVLYADFYTRLPNKEELREQLELMLSVARDIEERMNMLRRFKNEKQFQAGVHLLKGTVSAEISSSFLADLADVIIQSVLTIMQQEFAVSYGHIPGAQFCIIGLGKLGSREMTFGSDVDLVFVYSVPDFETPSTGEKSYSASIYYNRFCQRFLSSLTTASKEGRLYEVDTRLRPSGKQGLLAVSDHAIDHYFTELAWTFEFMALTKSRIIAGDAELGGQLEALFKRQLSRPRDADKVKQDVKEMRIRIAKEFPAADEWNVKYAEGGLLDIDFIAQALVLMHVNQHPILLQQAAKDIIEQATNVKILSKSQGKFLTEANHFLVQLLNMLRLTTQDTFDKNTALPGLKLLLTKNLGFADFETLNNHLLTVEKDVQKTYKDLIGN